MITEYTNYTKQNVPENIKAAGLNFSSLDISEEARGYLDIDTDMCNQVKDELKDFLEAEVNTTIPVCVLSHMFDQKRSKFLVQLKAEASIRDLNRKYYIFTYEDQKELYDEFDSIKNVEVHYIPLDNPVYLTLSGKRQYILEYCKDNNHDNAFFIEDDCFDFILPVGALGAEGSFRNKRYVMSFNFLFSFWSHLIRKYDLTYSGGANNMEWCFRDLRSNPFIKKNGQTIQAVHINVKACYENNIQFDHDAGWDDYDMILQQCVYSKGTQLIIFSYNTPSLKSGVSAMSSSSDALEKRCFKNSTALINKWGKSFVKEDTKKGLFNAKINWNTIRNSYKINYDLREVIGKSYEEASSMIKEAKAKIDAASIIKEKPDEW